MNGWWLEVIEECRSEVCMVVKVRRIGDMGIEEIRRRWVEGRVWVGIGWRLGEL